jgi:GWxTD domain-containing protein
MLYEQFSNSNNFANMIYRKLFLLLSIVASSLALEAQQVQALFSHSVFLMGGKTPYVETYLMVRGSTVRFVKNANGRYQGKVEVTLTASKGDEIKFADKYLLFSPEVDDTLALRSNFIDQQRIPLPPGDYELGLRVQDINSLANPVNASGPLHIHLPKDSIMVSNIQFVESYKKTERPGPLSKGGYDLVPHISEFYGSDEQKLIFYNETYHALTVLGENQKFLIKFHIEELSSQLPIAQFTSFERATSASVNVLMKEIDITDLPSGTFRLVVEARDRENNLLGKATQEFIRANINQLSNNDNYDIVSVDGTFTAKYTNPDSLAEHIRCLRPIAAEREKQYASNVLKSKDMHQMQQYFLSFWLNRSKSNPQGEWEKYRTEVVKEEKDFKTSIRRGYETDRGRVYLQYGPPDNRSISLHEPSAYPYEIWQYYKVNGQSNRRFVFYNPDLVSNDYILIHSDALGEIMNDNWQKLIYKRDNYDSDIDQERGVDHHGSQLQQNFQTPR